MANEFKHTDVGTGLTKVEWEAVDTHEADGQTANDMLYFNGTYWIRATPSTIRALLDLEIGTDVLAQQAIGIVDDNLLEVDGSPNDDEFARFTANGLEGRTAAEVLSDIGAGDVTAAANLTDNAIVRGDGGAKGIQTSLVTIDDSGDISIGAHKIKTTNLLIKEGNGTTLYLRNAADNAYINLYVHSLYFGNDLDSYLSGSYLGATGGGYFVFKAIDTGVGLVEVARMAEAADPYFAMGGTQQGKFYYSGYFTIDGNFHILGQNELRFYEGVNYVGFEAPALDADQIWVLPTADGDAGEYLKTDGGGNLSFDAPAGGGDMLVATYDPQSIAADAFDTDQHTDGVTNGVYTLTERTKLATVDANADVTGSNAPQAHVASHQNGGADEISVADLSGVLADDQHVIDAEAVSAVEAAGIEMAENTAILVDPALSADGKYTAIAAIVGTAGTNLAFGEVVYLAVADSKWEKAKGDAEATVAPMTGIVIVAGNEDAAVTVMLIGHIRADAAFPALTVAAPVFIDASTAGDVTTTELTTGQYQKCIGWATTADSIFVTGNADWVKVG